jgi:ubiquinone/menaquinone biosynthesis C-methylase UbiE
MKRCGILNLLVAALLAGTAVVAAQVPLVRVADIEGLLLELLEVRSGVVLADIGAGPDAFLATRMARHVGPFGRVYATDVGEQTLASLREVIRKNEVNNIEVIEGHPSRTNLPAECCDGIYIRNVYHHFADPPVMNRSPFDSLKPGGRLVVIDFYPRGLRPARPQIATLATNTASVLRQLRRSLCRQAFS